MEKIENQIIDLLKARNGVKYSWAVHSLSSTLNITSLTKKEVEDLIESMIAARKIMAIEYTADMFKTESLLVPAKTRINIRGQELEPPHRV